MGKTRILQYTISAIIARLILKKILGLVNKRHFTEVSVVSKLEYSSIFFGVNILGHDSVKWALSGGVADYEYTDKNRRLLLRRHQRVITKG